LTLTHLPAEATLASAWNHREDIRTLLLFESLSDVSHEGCLVVRRISIDVVTLQCEPPSFASRMRPQAEAWIDIPLRTEHCISIMKMKQELGDEEVGSSTGAKSQTRHVPLSITTS